MVDSNADVTVEIKLPEELADKELAVFPEDAVQSREEEMLSGSGGKRGFEPIVVATAIVSVAWIVERIVNHYLTSLGRGVLIDLTKPTPIISTVDVAEGTVIIHQADKQVKVVRTAETSNASLTKMIVDAWKHFSRSP